MRLAAAALACAALATSLVRSVAAQTPDRPEPAEPVVVVRGASGVGRAVPVYTIQGPGGAARYVNAADLATALGGRVDLRGDRARATLANRVVEVIDGGAFARVDGREVPLVAAPRVSAERALLPIQVVADVLPLTANGTLRFDAEGRTLAVLAAPSAAAPSVTLPSIIGRRRNRVATQESPTTATGASGSTNEPETPSAAVLTGRRRTVVVDAGHGGVDGGMRGAAPGGPVVLEKDVTLGIARALRTALQQRNIDVVLTRDRDVLVPLDERGRIANARRGDLFVSVHVNAANPRWREPASARGFETYFLSEARTEDARQVEERENESVRFESAAGPEAGGDPLRFIVSDLAQNEHLRASSRFAELVQRRLGRVHPGPNRGVHQAGFKVLVTASMPAVLVEAGFGSNAGDAEYLTSAAGQRAIAEAIADAAIEHLRRYSNGRAAAAERRP